jgi:hypothetical protein
VSSKRRKKLVCYCDQYRQTKKKRVSGHIHLNAVASVHETAMVPATGQELVGREIEQRLLRKDQQLKHIAVQSHLTNKRM